MLYFVQGIAKRISYPDIPSSLGSQNLLQSRESNLTTIRGDDARSIESRHPVNSSTIARHDTEERRRLVTGNSGGTNSTPDPTLLTVNISPLRGSAGLNHPHISGCSSMDYLSTVGESSRINQTPVAGPSSRMDFQLPAAPETRSSPFGGDPPGKNKTICSFAINFPYDQTLITL